MHYNIKNNKIHSIKPMEMLSVGFTRILHAVPGAPNVDVYSDNRLIAKNIPYSEYADYFPLVAEPHKISIYVAGTKDSPVLTGTVNIATDDILTIAAIGTLSNIEFLGIPSPNMSTDTSKSMVRFAHLSPNAPAVDITLPDGTILFGDVSFKEVTPAIPILPSEVTLQVRLAGTPTVALTVPNVKLEPNKSYTVYALGLAGEEPPLEALLVEEPKLEELLSLDGIEGIDNM
jgi:hypothetical protein